MRQKNLYRSDDILIRTAIIIGVISGIFILNLYNLYKNNLGDEDIFPLLVKIFIAASVPLAFAMAGVLIKKSEKKYLEIWNILERSVEVTFSEIESVTGFARDTILKALRVINRKSGTVYLVDSAHDLVYDGRLSGRVAGAALCPGCGGNVEGLVKLSLTDAPECPNCGRKVDLSPQAASKDERLRAIREEDRRVQEIQTEIYKGDFKTWVFVLLVMFFWPAAIWYIIKKHPLRRI